MATSLKAITIIDGAIAEATRKVNDNIHLQNFNRDTYNEEVIGQIVNLFATTDNLEQLVSSLNNLYSNYQTLSSKAKYTQGSDASELNQVNQYQKDYDTYGFHTNSFYATPTAGSTPSSDDYWTEENGKRTWKGGDNYWGSVTNERRANYFTDEQAKQLNERLKEKGYEYVKDEKYPGDDNYSYYKIRRISDNGGGGGSVVEEDPDPNGGGGGDKGGDKNKTTFGNPPGLTTNTDNRSGIDLTPLESLAGLLDSYRKNAAIKAINMSEQYPLKQGYRYYNAVKDGFNTQQAVSAQTEEERKRAAQNALKYGDADAYINSMLQVNNQAQINKNNAAAQSEQIYNASLTQQEKNFNDYNALNAQISNDNANIIAKNRSLRNQARLNEIVYNDASYQKHREYIKSNAAKIKKAETDRRNAQLQQRLQENYLNEVNTYLEEYQAAIAEAAKQTDTTTAQNLMQAAAKTLEEKKQKAQLKLQQDALSQSEIYGHEYYYTPRYTSQQSSRPRITGSLSSSAVTQKTGGKLSKRLQSGGSISLGGVTYNPHSPNIPVSDSMPGFTQGQYQPVTPKSDKENKNIFSDDMLKQFAEKMLPSDFQVFKSQVERFNFEMKTFGRSNQSFFDLLSIANRGMHEREQFKNSVSHSIDNNTMEDYALDTYGNFIALDTKTNTIKSIDKKKVYEDNKNGKKVDYQILTNVQVAQLRADNSQFAFNSTLSTRLSTTVSSMQVHKDIIDIVSKMGDVTTKGDLTDYIQQFYGSKISEPTAEQWESIKRFGSQWFGYNAEGHTSKNGENALTEQNIKYTFQYLWSILPKQHRDVLLAQSIRTGTYTGKDYETLANVLNDAIRYRLDREETQVAPKESRDGSGSGSGGDGLSHTIPVSQNTAFFDGNIFRTNGNFVFSPEDNVALGVVGSVATSLDYMADGDGSIRSGKPIEAGPIGKTILDNSSIGSLLDQDNIYIGNRKATKDEVKDYVCLNGNKYYTVFLPEVNGQIDFSIGSKISSVYEQIMSSEAMQQAPEQNKPQVFNALLQQNFKEMAPYLVMDSYGRLKYQGNELGKYFVVYGYRDKDFFTDLNPFSTEITGSEETRIEKEMHELYNKWDVDDPGWGALDWYKELYKTPIFIKVDDHANETLAIADKGVVERKQTVEQVVTRETAQSAPQRVIRGSSSIMNQ